MRVIDASSIVHAWDTYPVNIFPPLWAWIEDECLAGELCIPRPAMDEVGHVSPDCEAWLRKSGIKVLPVTNSVLVEARRIQAALGITNDNYHPAGVDENDILIIATARTASGVLISNESKQPSLPENFLRYKIPAVCAQFAPPPCVNFLDHLKQSGQQFG